MSAPNGLRQRGPAATLTGNSKSSAATPQGSCAFGVGCAHEKGSAWRRQVGPWRAPAKAVPERCQGGTVEREGSSDRRTDPTAAKREVYKYRAFETHGRSRISKGYCHEILENSQGTSVLGRPHWHRRARSVDHIDFRLISRRLFGAALHLFAAAHHTGLPPARGWALFAPALRGGSGAARIAVQRPPAFVLPHPRPCSRSIAAFRNCPMCRHRRGST